MRLRKVREISDAGAGASRQKTFDPAPDAQLMDHGSQAHGEGGSAAEHWNSIYGSRTAVAVSWYQADPSVSLRLVRQAAPDTGATVVDVGGGTSVLVDRLLEAGYRHLTLVDASPVALAEVARRLSGRAEPVGFVAADVLEWAPPPFVDVWHDRAVFHFLDTDQARAEYVAKATLAVVSGGAVVLATFAPEGPRECSGLPVVRYSAAELAELFAGGFDLVHEEREDHVTPSGAVQPFTWVVLRRR